ncbi:beta-phosphoglucomutase [Alkalibacillus haloalkaliphilus]|uniref:beta-phosphoglucomutase n=1 Tax=Alkalibacillus haloalkaliphilus TaxID=94136 RepID=UPI0029358C18|nr:beta-phosphoglucomutase [Alkalibacillus haloalkaliphilus]MDV2582243.1 beta-phosphoglucomutase [Alkalibacillus haloalkaliphilus]
MIMPKAFIFDLDGVITDTAELHYQAWKRLADSLGITIDREFNEELKGVGRMESLEKILALDPKQSDLSLERKEALATEKNDHYVDLLGTISEDDILPGITGLLKTIRQQGIKVGLGSASKNATHVLQELKLIDQFDYIVDAAQVSKGKPDPETFTNAADYFGVDYVECIGIEDAPSGVTAVNSAGMFSVGVGTAEALSHAEYRVDDTTELDFEAIIQAYQSFGVSAKAE